ASGEGKVNVFLRVGNVYKDKYLVVKSGDEVILKKNAMIFTPGEMETIAIDKSKLKGDVFITLVDKEVK
ncbi:MAG: pyridine nucleotide-disulfide oxidoreductase, partial [Clostridia bacterium]|nr:pyridine nucleotide-disulfide oxidoreductase [Clostridia bacterium]